MTMFSAERWVQAVLHCAGTSAHESLAALKALVNGLGLLHCEGRGDADRLEAALRAALEKSGAGGQSAELACRTLVLLARKHLFASRYDLIAALERALNRRSGIVTVTIDSASPLEPETRSRFIRELKEKTKAADLRITTRIVPELGGGYRLFMEDEVFDASLKTQCMRMSLHILKH